MYFFIREPVVIGILYLSETLKLIYLQVAFCDQRCQLSLVFFTIYTYLSFLFFRPCTTSAIQKLFTTSINAFLGGCKIIIPFSENLIQPILQSHTSVLNKNAVNTFHSLHVGVGHFSPIPFILLFTSAREVLSKDLIISYKRIFCMKPFNTLQWVKSK